MPSFTLTAPFDGWLCPLEEVPDPVFAGRLLGDGLAIDPLGDTLHAPADGEVAAIHDARHAVTLRLAPGVELLIHVGLETVALEGDGFIALARVGERVKAGAPLLRIALDRVAQRARSLVTPIVITEAPGLTWHPHRTSGAVRQGEPLGELRGGIDVAVAAAFTPSASLSLRVPLAHGLHARPSARLAERARDFDADVRVALDGRQANLASPSAMLRLGVRHGDTITLLAGGPQADAAIAALGEMIAGGMGEGAPFGEDLGRGLQVPERAEHPHPTLPLKGRAIAHESRCGGVPGRSSVLCVVYD